MLHKVWKSINNRITSCCAYLIQCNAVVYTEYKKIPEVHVHLHVHEHFMPVFNTVLIIPFAFCTLSVKATALFSN